MLRRSLVVCLSAIAMSASDLEAEIIASSSFDTSADGWTAVTQGPVCVRIGNPSGPLSTTWQPNGGATGGFLRTPDGANTTFWRAPSGFLGDRSAAYGGSISFEYRLTTADGDVYNAVDDVLLQSADVVLIADAPQPSRDRWGHSRVPLLPGYWKVGTCSGPLATGEQILAVLSQLTDIYIRGEHVNGGETNDIDSIILSSDPVDESCRAIWQEVDTAGPTGRWRHAIAIDTDQEVLVLFGGDTGETDTWEYDLTTGIWTRIESSVAPSRRGGHAMAYDPARQRIVLTGGGYLGQRSDQVWEYDTVTNQWSQTVSLPQARVGHSMAYDTQRGMLVLYGGISGGAAGERSVLERSASSATWSSRESDPNPGAQVGYAMAFDESHSRTVLIGGGTTTMTVWEWDGVTGTWEQRTVPGAAPSTRANPAVVYDSQRAKILMIRGENFRDTWEYDGGETPTWTLRGNTANGTGLDEHAAAYDSERARVLVHGGLLNNATPARVLLEWDPNSNVWSTAWSLPSPGPRELFGFAYDEAGQRVILYGGGLVTRAGVTQRIGSAVFALDGGQWSLPEVIGDPSSRYLVPLVHDPVRNSLWAYGGAVAPGSSNASARLWQLQLPDLSWVDTTDQTPGQRFDHVAVYDRSRDRIVVHGGVNELGTRLGDTRIYNPATNTWSSLASGEPSPGLRSGAGAAFDRSRGVVVVFGGHTGESGTFDNSTWEWDGLTWIDRTPTAGNPPARLRPNMVFDTARNRIVMYGGIMNIGFNGSDPVYNAQSYRDLWEWDGIQWSRIALQSQPRPIGAVNSGAVYDEARARIVHFGGGSVRFTDGVGGQHLNGQTWELVLPAPTCGSICPDCPADYDQDGGVTGGDLAAFFSDFEAGETCADVDGDGGVTGGDIGYFFAAFEAGGC